MQIAIAITTVDRKTGSVLKKSVAGYEDVDENTHMEPLLAILFEGFQKSCPWRDRKEANANEPQA